MNHLLWKVVRGRRAIFTAFRTGMPCLWVYIAKRSRFCCLLFSGDYSVDIDDAGAFGLFNDDAFRGSTINYINLFDFLSCCSFGRYNICLI